jgi:hypothetical protein
MKYTIGHKLLGGGVVGGVGGGGGRGRGIVEVYWVALKIFEIQ